MDQLKNILEDTPFLTKQEKDDFEVLIVCRKIRMFISGMCVPRDFDKTLQNDCCNDDERQSANKKKRNTKKLPMIQLLHVEFVNSELLIMKDF